MIEVMHHPRHLMYYVSLILPNGDYYELKRAEKVDVEYWKHQATLMNLPFRHVEVE